MLRFALAIVGLALFACSADAGPFRRARASACSSAPAATACAPAASVQIRTRTFQRTRTRSTSCSAVADVPQVFGVSSEAAGDALAEVNAARAARGLPAYIADPALTVAAQTCARLRAVHRLAGHTANDFAALPAGTTAGAAGCGALEPSWGWGTCATYERWTYAGAAVVMGDDGKRYMHLFVR